MEIVTGTKAGASKDRLKHDQLLVSWVNIFNSRVPLKMAHFHIEKPIFVCF